MNEFKEELKKRWSDRKTGKAFSWTHLVVRILVFVFIVLIIRFFAGEDTDKFRDYLKFSKKNITEMKDIE